MPDSPSPYAIERADDKELGHSYPDFAELRDRNHSFQQLTGYGIVPAALDTGDKPPIGILTFTMIAESWAAWSD